MDLITVKQLYRQREDYFGKSVSVGGWVRSNRDSKNFGFLVINDGTYFDTLQVVYTDALPNFEEITHFGAGAAVIFRERS